MASRSWCFGYQAGLKAQRQVLATEGEAAEVRSGYSVEAEAGAGVQKQLEQQCDEGQ